MKSLTSRSRLACNSHPDPHWPSAVTLMHPPRRLSCALRSYSSVYALRGDSVGDSHMLSEATLMRSPRLLLYALRGHSHALSKSLNLLFHFNRLVLKLSLSFCTRHPCTLIECRLPRHDTHFGARYFPSWNLEPFETRDIKNSCFNLFSALAQIFSYFLKNPLYLEL